MADRFPSLEDFDEGNQTEIKDATAEPSTDDFLAREKALLGDDADQFATAEDHAADGGNDDLLGGGDSGSGVASPGDAQFESQFPDLSDPNQGVSDSGTITGAGPSISYNSGYGVSGEQEEEEPQVVKDWREQRDAQIAKRAEQFAQQRAETVKEAQQNIDDFYDNYNNKKDKGIAQTRKEADEFLASREDVTSGGTSWERIAKIVDVSGKGAKGGASGSGKERFREMLVSLRKDENAPVASGV